MFVDGVMWVVGRKYCGVQPVLGKGWGNGTGACCARNAHGVSGTQKKEKHVGYSKGDIALRLKFWRDR